MAKKKRTGAATANEVAKAREKAAKALQDTFGAVLPLTAEQEHKASIAAKRNDARLCRVAPSDWDEHISKQIKIPTFEEFERYCEEMEMAKQRGQLSESEYTRKVCKEMAALGAKILPIVGGAAQPPGWPDRYVAWRGQYLNPDADVLRNVGIRVAIVSFQCWLEFKSATGKLTDLQRMRIRELERTRTPVFIVRPAPIGMASMRGWYWIENVDGRLIAEYDGSGKDLLQALAGIAVAYGFARIES